MKAKTITTKPTETSAEAGIAMTDRYERIREALEMGPTPGPRTLLADEGILGRPVPGRWAVEADGAYICLDPEWDEEFYEESIANAALIAACDPDIIRALLEERDAQQAEIERLREALSRILENEASDWKFAEEFGGYVLDDELREEARAALESARADGWQPIETAPKPDIGANGFGKRLLLVVDCGDGTIPSVRKGYWEGTDWYLDCYGCLATKYGYRVTHWRPLPPPPATEASRAKEGK